MDVQSEKFKLIEWLVGLNDISILEKVAEVRNRTVEDSYKSDLESIGIEELKVRAQESEEAIRKGELTNFEDLQEEMKAW